MNFVDYKTAKYSIPSNRPWFTDNIIDGGDEDDEIINVGENNEDNIKGADEETDEIFNIKETDETVDIMDIKGADETDEIKETDETVDIKGADETVDIIGGKVEEESIQYSSVKNFLSLFKNKKKPGSKRGK